LERNSPRLSWLLVALAALVVAFAPIPGPGGASPSERIFRLQASQFAYSPAQLHVEPGDTVTIELTSTDSVHGLYIDGYGHSFESDPGQTATFTFIADRPGSFRFRCNVTCGALHPFMIGKFTVGSNLSLYRGIGLALLAAIVVAAKAPRPGAMVDAA
jgi:heme/copper-type cytochrome/quinol oxidase subunit 2